MPDVDVVVELNGEDVLAGRLFSRRRREHESASFTYETDYLARGDAYELDPALPLVHGALHTPVGLAMFRAFSDAAPDRWGRNLIQRAERRRAKQANVAPRRLGEVDVLLGVRDDLRQGAIRFRDPAAGTFLASADLGVPKLTDLPHLLDAAAHVETDEETDADLRDLLRVGSSLGGSRPKAHLLDTDGSISIAKFPSASQDSWNVMAWEKVALDLARDAGIRAPDSRLIAMAGRSVLIVKRFDRDDRRRIGYASAMTMLEARDGDQRSYLEIADVIERVSPAARNDLHELWRRIAFNILISNTDDHLRNHAFLRNRTNSWSLSPAFDLNPNPQPGPKILSTALDDHDPSASIDNLIAVSAFFRLKRDMAITVLGEVLSPTLRWREVATGHGLDKSEITRVEPAFDHAETDRARALTGL